MLIIPGIFSLVNLSKNRGRGPAAGVDHGAVGDLAEEVWPAVPPPARSHHSLAEEADRQVHPEAATLALRGSLVLARLGKHINIRG